MAEEKDKEKEKKLSVFEQQERQRKKKEKAKKKTKKKKAPKLIGQMFLNNAEIKTVHANKDNIIYYNSIYDKFRSEGAKQKARVRKEVELRNRPSWIKQLCCFCCKDKNEKMRIENIIFDDIVYSSGESGEDEIRLSR